MEITFESIRVPLDKESALKFGAAAVTAATTVALGAWACQQVSDMKERRTLKGLVIQRQKEREEQFAAYRDQYKMTPELLEIANLPLEMLTSKLQIRQLTAKQVLEAFIAKSLQVTDEFNCITAFNPKAMELAEELDRLERPKGPLHGVPFCVKDDTNVIGMDSTVGLARNLNKPASRSATTVEILQDLGGIPYCRTNVPQTCASYASHNHIFGQTANPLNKNLSPGGSSAGTGSLLGGKGCLFGIGSDTGGSARLPAHFCGVSSLKASKNRISRKGSLQCNENCIGLPPNPCLMAQRASDVATVFKLLTESNQFNKYDAKAAPLPWNTSIFESTDKLRIGYFTSLADCPTVGDTPNTILKAKSILEGLGHTLILFELKYSSEYLKLAKDLLFADGGTHLVQKLHNEQVSPALNGIAETCSVPAWKKSLNTCLRKWLAPLNIQVKPVALGMDVEKSTDLWDCTAKRRAAIENLLEEMINLDLLLCPVFPAPALPFESIDRASLDPGVYLCIWNFMDFPAGVVGKVGYETGSNFGNPAPGLEQIPYYQKYIKPNLKETIGMPIGVQFVGKPYREEIVLRAMVELERGLQGSDPHVEVAGKREDRLPELNDISFMEDSTLTSAQLDEAAASFNTGDGNTYSDNSFSNSEF